MWQRPPASGFSAFFCGENVFAFCGRRWRHSAEMPLPAANVGFSLASVGQSESPSHRGEVFSIKLQNRPHRGKAHSPNLCLIKPMRIESLVNNNGTRDRDPDHGRAWTSRRRNRRPFALFLLPTGKHPEASGSIRKLKNIFAAQPPTPSVQTLTPIPTPSHCPPGRLRKAAESKKYPHRPPDRLPAFGRSPGLSGGILS